MPRHGTPPPRVLALVFGLGLAALAGCAAQTPPMPAVPCPQPWSLTDAQRRHFLEYYSPLILKQADEFGHRGRDWITNFDFDRDDTLANNAANWSWELSDYVRSAAHGDWRIRPTLYSAAIEHTDCGTKSLVLLYHVYHAMQWSSIHDWERVEIRLDGVGPGGPGTGEAIRFVVITEHELHHTRPVADLRFAEQHTDGKHVLVWQAPWSLIGGPNGAELHFVDESWEAIRGKLANGGDAVVEIDRGDRETFHYAFVVGADAAAVADLGATTVEADPRARSWGKWHFERADGRDVRRIVYELQDTADLMYTHHEPTRPTSLFARLANLCGGSDCPYACAGDTRPWTCREKGLTRIRIDDPLLDEGGGLLVPAGVHGFPAQSCDSAHLVDPRNGYPWKHWFWGTYYFGRGDKFTSDAYGDPWKQHYYFLHEGTVGSGDVEVGEPLPDGWHTPAAGGSDGRWKQIFPD